MDRAKDAANGAVATLCSSVYSIVVLCIFMSLPASMIGMGAAYIDDCPRERFIPVYLIVGGSTALGLKVMLLALMICRVCKKEILALCFGVVFIVLCIINAIFSFAWFIAGNVWVFRIKDDFTLESTEPTYCDSTLYWYSFWLIVVNWILIGFSCCIYPCISRCCQSGQSGRSGKSEGV